VIRAPLIVLVVCGAVLGAGCASPPGDVKLADAILDKAAAAGADDYAPEAMAAARAARAALETELKQQHGRWIASYDRARDLAVAVQAAGDKAAAEARGGRDRALAAANAGEAPLGPNLFQNPDFANGTAGWEKHPESDATVTVETETGGRAWHVSYRKGNWAVIHQSQPLQPDSVYVYEATVKSTAPVVALYWEAETGRFREIDRTYPDWTHLRYAFVTPHWNGKPYATWFHPLLMKGPGDAWIKDLRLSRVTRAPRT